MKKFLTTILSLTFAFQPIAVGAASVNISARPTNSAITRTSVRALRAGYNARNDMRVMQQQAKPASKLSTYAPIGDIIPALPSTGLSMGAIDAPVTVVEFIDYECVHCADFHTKTFPYIKKRYIDGGKVRFVVRHFPLERHAYAAPAAEAVECARTQGDSVAWKLHNAILETVQAGSDFMYENRLAIIESVAGSHATDILSCANAKQKKAVLDADIKDAMNGGINSVPSFWVLGPKGKAELIQGAATFDVFQKVLDGMVR